MAVALAILKPRLCNKALSLGAGLVQVLVAE